MQSRIPRTNKNKTNIRQSTSPYTAANNQLALELAGPEGLDLPSDDEFHTSDNMNTQATNKSDFPPLQLTSKQRYTGLTTSKPTNADCAALSSEAEMMDSSPKNEEPSASPGQHATGSTLMWSKPPCQKKPIEMRIVILRKFLATKIPLESLAAVENAFDSNKLHLPSQFARTISSTVEQQQKLVKMGLTYPEARKEDQSDDFHGTKVSDVYRWLEDPDSPETQAFVDAQNEISRPYLDGCDEWKKLNAKLTKLWNYPKFSAPSQHGERYYFFKNSGLQNQSVMYEQTALTDDGTIFLDPNSLSNDGTIALAQTSFSDDGKYFAYGLSESGSDWIKIKIRNVETGADFSEALEKVKFSCIAWTKDNKGFFYGMYPDQLGKTDGSETKSNENQKLYYHRIGEEQDKDVLVVEFPEEPTWRIMAEVSDCGKYLILPIVKDCRDNIVFFADLEEEVDGIQGKLSIHQIIDRFEADYDYVTNTGPKVVFRTNKDAPNYRLIEIDFNNPAQENWKTLVKEHEKDVLDWTKCAHGNKLILGYIHDVKSVLQIHSLETGEFIRKLPLDIGAVERVSADKKYSEIFYNFVSFLNAGTIYRFNLAAMDTDPSVMREVHLNLDGFDKDKYAVEQVFYDSTDSTKVPMFIIRKKTTSETNQPRPCLLYGYGGFNISLQPSFSLTGLMFIDTFDGVVAFPNIRGGGEYGEKWHNAGRLLNKQNVFEDFQSAAKYLICKKYTSKDKLAIQGGSNGGLLVGACINQRPDLFGAAIAQVGVMDMLRFHKFTIGHAWCSDYGNPSEKEHFDNLYKYSPLHNVHCPKNEKEEYPATLILTADHDDRVSPLHSLKFIAALHDAVKDSKYQNNPILLRVYSKAGHGAGKPTTKKIEEATDILTFCYKTLQTDVLNL